MNLAPLRRAARAVSLSSTVPAPNRTSFPNFWVTSFITSRAPGTENVISITEIPPSRIALATSKASPADATRMTGTTPSSIILASTSFIVSPPMVNCSWCGFHSAFRNPHSEFDLSRYPQSRPLDLRFHFFQGGPVEIARHDVFQRRKGISVFYAFFGSTGQVAVDEPGGKGITRPDPVHDFDRVGSVRVDLPVGVGDC